MKECKEQEWVIYNPLIKNQKKPFVGFTKNYDDFLLKLYESCKKDSLIDTFGKVGKFDYGSYVFIMGSSCFEDVVRFYSAFLNKVDNNWKQCFSGKLLLVIMLDYMNSSSVRAILHIIVYFRDTFNVDVLWLYDTDDEDSLEKGQEIGSIVKVPHFFIGEVSTI